ncbi:MAG: FAD-dependent oxidoreductase [Atribacterota bacterium]
MPRDIEAEVVVIGGGPAGMAAAHSAWEQGAKSVFLLEREKYLGGILNQCIHPGFGLQVFGEELTGPEYASRYIEKLGKTGVQVMTETAVLDLEPSRTIRTVCPRGVHEFHARSVILSMGCREKTRGMIMIPGTRPAGIYTAGLAQYLVNVEGYLPGRKVVILGSGDIGLIMARRLSLEGVTVEAVVEVRNSLSGLVRNYVQCLLDFDLPLLLSHTVTGIVGKERLEGVLVSQVDERWHPVPGTERFLECDTLLLSVGLIPENEISQKAGISLSPISRGPYVDETFATDVEGFYACGNVASVFDLVDYVTFVSQKAGEAAASHRPRGKVRFVLQVGVGTGLVIPQRIRNIEEGILFIRPSQGFRETQIIFRKRDEVFARKKTPICRPSEMIRIDIPSIPWPPEGGEVTIEITGNPIQGI